jgi:hypothetical protein
VTLVTVRCDALCAGCIGEKVVSTGPMLCYALSRTSLFKLKCSIAMKVAAVPFALALAILTWAQSGAPHPKRQVSDSKSHSPTKKQLAPKERAWCKVLKSALIGAEAAEEPPVRSYLLDAVAGGLIKCDPSRGRRALVDSFTATLAIPEHEEEIRERKRNFYSEDQQPDQATREEVFKLQMKHLLQESALRHLVNVDEAKVDSLLPQAEAQVRGKLFREMISQATHAKKFDRAQELLSRTVSKEWMPSGFPYGEATLLMLALPPERDVNKQEIFRLAIAADRERHSLPSGTEDFASMIVRFWRQIPPALALDAIHQVLDKADFEMEGTTFDAASVNARFSNEHDYRVFELLPVLRQLDSDEADKLLRSSQQAQLQLKRFPEGIESIDPSMGEGVSQKDAPVRMLGGSMGAVDQGGSSGSSEMDELNAASHQVYEISRVAEDNPREAIAAAATLPESVGFDWGTELPRAKAYLVIARMLKEKNPSTAKYALEAMADSLKPAAQAYGATDHWIEGSAIAREIGEGDLALDLLRSGMEQADRLRTEDADPDDPNIAIKAFWPSVCAYTRLIFAAAKISPQTALEQVHVIKDPEVLLLVEVRLASKELGAHDFQSQTMVYKNSFSMFGGCAVRE